MRLSVRVAPGLRVSASSRGLRAHMGPRAARLHVGAGRPGVSTGVGPVSVYQSLGGASRTRSGASRSAPTRHAATQSPAAAAKAAEAGRIRAVLDDISSLHRATFAPAQPPAPPTVDLSGVREDLLARHLRNARLGVPWWAVGRRRLARQRAEERTDQEFPLLREDAEFRASQDHGRLLQRWDRLLANDPEPVLEALASAFEDNGAYAAPLGVEGDTALVVLVVPPDSAVPDRLPGVTESGNLSLRKISRSDRAAWYVRLVCGVAAATANEALAVAPGLGFVQLVCVRQASTGVGWEAVAAVEVSRDVAGWVTRQADATTLLAAAHDAVVRQAPRTGELLPLTARDDEVVARVLDQIETDPDGVFQ